MVMIILGVGMVEGLIIYFYFVCFCCLQAIIPTFAKLNG